MAVINTPKSFDKAQIDAAVLPKIEEFVDYVNQQFDQLSFLCFLPDGNHPISI